MVKFQTDVDGYRGEGIHRVPESVQTLFQTGAWFCYKCSRQWSGSGGNMLLDFTLFFIEDYRLVCTLDSFQ